MVQEIIHPTLTVEPPPLATEAQRYVLTEVDILIVTKGSKAVLVRQVMAHYGLSPTSKADQSQVVDPASNGAGCGIQAANVNAVWAALAASAP